MNWGTWILRKNDTGEIFGKHFSSFNELRHYLEQDLILFKDIVIKGNKKRLIEFVSDLAGQYSNLTMHQFGAGGNPDSNAWEYLKPLLINEYINLKFYHRGSIIYQRLIARFKDSFSGKIIVSINDNIDINQLGLIYTSAKIFDSNFDKNLVIVSEDQLNYIKLAYPSETILFEIDVDHILKDLKEIKLYD